MDNNSLYVQTNALLRYGLPTLRQPLNKPQTPDM